jgi:hypothetical protein
MRKVRTKPLNGVGFGLEWRWPRVDAIYRSGGWWDESSRRRPTAVRELFKASVLNLWGEEGTRRAPFQEGKRSRRCYEDAVGGAHDAAVAADGARLGCQRKKMNQGRWAWPGGLQAKWEKNWFRRYGCWFGFVSKNLNSNHRLFWIQTKEIYSKDLSSIQGFEFKGKFWNSFGNQKSTWAQK